MTAPISARVGWVRVAAHNALLCACAAALAFSALAFGALFLRPQIVERQVHSAIIQLLEREVSARFGRRIEGDEVSAAVQLALRRHVDELGDSIDGRYPDRVAVVLAHLCHYACGSPAEIARSIRTQLSEKVGKLESGIARVRSWSRSRYSGVVQELVLELRVFTGTNVVLFLLALLGLWRGSLQGAVGTLSGLLLIATAFSSYCYVVNQNWLLTLVMADYLGWGYLVGAGAAFAFLVDVVFLRARVTHTLLSMVG